MIINVDAYDLTEAINRLPNPATTREHIKKVALRSPVEPTYRPTTSLSVGYIFTFRNEGYRWALVEIEKS